MTIDARFQVERGDFALDVELTLPDRGVSALFGPSGSGKTTLLRAIAGLDRLENGFLRVGTSTWQEGTHFVPPHQRSLGYVFQEASLFEHLTVLGNLRYGVRRVPPEERRVSIERAIELLDIAALLDRRTTQLSGGERQRVAIARALAVSPRLLLMDEPLASLDEERKGEILPYLRALHRDLELPVVYVTHSHDEVARLADHLVLLDRGKALGSGPIGEMMTRLDLPLASAADAESLIETTVAEHDDTFQLTRLESPAGPILVARMHHPVGSRVRTRIAARDVSLTLERQHETSILNIFPATVEELADTGGTSLTARLSVDGLPLLARVTRRSVHTLAIEPGRQVFAQAKSVAILD